MSIDVAAERLSAAEDIRNAPGALVTVRTPVYSGDVRTGVVDRKTYALLLATVRTNQLADTAEMATETTLMMAALEWNDVAGQWAGVLVVDTGYTVLVEGRWLTVMLPGRCAPNGDPIFYKARASAENPIYLKSRAASQGGVA